jgi:hypothetical protein
MVVISGGLSGDGAVPGLLQIRRRVESGPVRYGGMMVEKCAAFAWIPGTLRGSKSTLASERARED